MNKRVKLYSILGAAVVLLFGTVAVPLNGAGLAEKRRAQTQDSIPTQEKSEQAKRLEREFKLGRNIEILINMFRDVDLYYVDPTDPDQLLSGATQGLVSRLDPYTEFISEKEMATFEVMTTGKYGGVGSLIRQKGDWVYIAQPYQGSPADRAGLVVGDKIVAIDGESAKGIGSESVSSKMKGEPGTSFTMTIEKLYTGEVETIEIERERIVISGVPYYGFVADSIGYIEHSDFTQDCSEDMRKAFMELRKEGMKGLIIDYRSNGGGILKEAVKILSMFVPKGTEVVSMKGRSPESVVGYKTETEPIDLDLPIVVLTNSGSASAAEIVSGALQDLDRGVLVGSRTFGKGLVQSTRPTGYNSYAKITTSKYYIPSGRCVQAIDYAHQNEDGSVASVPDSLVREFTTANGRKVYDGGGVMPDVKMEPVYMSRFTIITYAKGYIGDFGDQYMKHNRESVDAEEFELSDKAYNEFTRFMDDKDVEYESETAILLKRLRQSAERDLYIDQIGEQITEIEKGLADDKESFLALYRGQLTKLIEDEIVLRHHYQKGVTRRSLKSDTMVEMGVNILRDAERYTNIITSQDTDRK